MRCSAQRFLLCFSFSILMLPNPQAWSFGWVSLTPTALLSHRVPSTTPTCCIYPGKEGPVFTVHNMYHLNWWRGHYWWCTLGQVWWFWLCICACVFPLQESLGSNGGGEERSCDQDEEDGNGDGAGVWDESQRESAEVERLGGRGKTNVTLVTVCSLFTCENMSSLVSNVMFCRPLLFEFIFQLLSYMCGC